MLETLPARTQNSTDDIGLDKVSQEGLAHREARDEIDSSPFGATLQPQEPKSSYPESQSYASEGESNARLNAIKPTAMPKKRNLSREHQSMLSANHLFMNKLVQKNLLDHEYASSTVSGKFLPGKLEHILIGDMKGGAHHLPTLVAMNENQKTIVASQIYDESKNIPRDKQQFSARLKQGILSNGVFRSDVVKIGVDDIAYKKAGPTRFFPNEWSAQQVIDTIIKVADTPPKSFDKERKYYTHEAVIDGVKTRVITTSDNRIITAYPRSA